MASPTTLEVIGGQGGGPFSFTGEKNGVSLEKIWVWVEASMIKAVRAWLSDGANKTFGIPSGSPQEYVFSPGECFTSLSLWGNGEGTRLGAIKFKTNKGGNFSAQMTSLLLTTEFPIDVGSGYCLGIAGRSGSDIDNLGFMFLNKVESAVLTKVSYPPLTQLIPKVVEEELKSVTYENKTSAKEEQKIETSERVIIKSSWSMSRSLTATFSMEVKAGIPEIVKGPKGNGVSIGTESTYSVEQMKERNETLITTVEVPPKKKVNVNITLGRISFDLPYTGTVKITCKNGGVLEYQTKGQYKGVFYTDVKVKTVQSDQSDQSDL